ncbi:MAG: ATP synthase F1 subunit delta [Acidobacteria bacterium]|nr:ATP synthase F1 subunit delta [Acidobacteriota bacterium]
MKPIAVARRYALALADAAGDAAGGRGQAALEKIAADVGLASEALRGDARLTRFFADPSIGEREKQATIETLARRGKMHDLTRSFLQLLVRNRRLGALAAIAQAFEAIKNDRLGVLSVETTTAVPLSSSQVKRLREALEKMTGRKVEVKLRVDPAVLGGARTRIGSKVYDGTLSRQLALLRERLAQAR